MSTVSYFKNAQNFVAKDITFNSLNTYLSGIDVLYEHAATGAMHDSDERYPPPLCHPGTREVVILRIKDWYGFLTRPNKKPIMWIHAPAGYGKTAVAGTIAKWLEEVQGLDFSPLGATFHFWRTSPERNSPARFIVTIAYQLAMSIPELAPHIDNAVKRNPMILRKALEVQLVKLVVEPFKALGELDTMPNRLIIVDGVDECINSDQEYRVERKYAEDQEKSQIRILELIRLLESHHLPLSFLVLSRPEAWIKEYFQSSSLRSIVEVVDLYTLCDHFKDTEAYIRAELTRIAARVTADGMDLEEDEAWPGEDVERDLVWQANGHMLYASTAIRHIDSPYGDPRALLKGLVYGANSAHSSPFSTLQELYMQIMRSCPESNRPCMIQVLEDVLTCSLYFSEEADSRQVFNCLDHLAGRVPGQGLRAIRPLYAVLRPSDAPHQGGRGFKPFVHSSFVEFLSDPGLSLEFAIDHQKTVRRILSRYLDFMARPSEKQEFRHCFSWLAWSRLFGQIVLEHPRDSQHLQLLKRLLSIDLVPLVKEAIKDDARMLGEQHFLDSVLQRGSGNLIVPLGFPWTPCSLETELLIDQAVCHVVSSFETALVYFLNQPPHVWPGIFPTYFGLLLDGMQPLWEVNIVVDSGNQVVKALKKLDKEHPEHIVELRRRNTSIRTRLLSRILELP